MNVKRTGVYLKNSIKRTAKNLINLHNTKNIYKLYKYYGINIIYGNLKIKGCFFMNGNNYFVAINKKLSIKKKEIILIHELAHFLFHQDYLLRC